MTTDIEEKQGALALDWPLVPGAGPVPSHWLERWIYYARIAPSTHNTQPWKFIVGRNEIDVVVDHRRWLNVSDPQQRELYISMGCAIESIRLAADFANCETSVSYFPVHGDATLVARVKMEGTGSRREFAMPEMLPFAVTRRTSHKKFDPARPVTDIERRAIYTCFGDPGVSLHFITDRGALDSLARLELEADWALFANDEYRDELARWIGDGGLGANWLLSKVGQFAVGMLHAGSSIAQGDADRVSSSPLAALLSTRGDMPVDRVHVGEAYMRVTLLVESLGLRLQPVSQVLELDSTRQRLADALDLQGRHAQHLFRLGHAAPEPAEYRRRPMQELMLRGVI